MVEEIAKAKEREKEEEKKREEARKAEQERRIGELKSTYMSLADAVSTAFTAIYESQLKALDKQIEGQKKRMDSARELAERGNTEAIEKETARMEELQQSRERTAQRQLQLNAIIQASNSAVAVTEAIGAVVGAAAKGDPYTIAARVAAAVAAMVAGIAAIQSAFGKVNSFADGVVGFRGKGGPRDDANWVRISSGESVITADGTQKNRALLEAINKGADLKLIDPLIPNMLPILQQPSLAGAHSGYASKHEMKNLEGKLDEVVSAIEDNRLRQNIFFNEQGVGIMTERAVNRNRKRWT
jgi:hypothetical protein